MIIPLKVFGQGNIQPRAATASKSAVLPLFLSLHKAKKEEALSVIFCPCESCPVSISRDTKTDFIFLNKMQRLRILHTKIATTAAGCDELH